VITRRFHIANMHCVHCAMNISWSLEDTPGVTNAHTSYAGSWTEVTFNPALLTVEQIMSVIREAGYEAQPAEA
jgi:copper chaperone CopZ